ASAATVSGCGVGAGPVSGRRARLRSMRGQSILVPPTDRRRRPRG
ncbi:hypothetical protein HMPREF0731_4508, partial [Pseudoroseomonas cervicalis ATCC 49957]